MIRMPQVLEKRPFLRQMATLMTGSAAAQVITLIFTPVIARLYSPEAYGLQGLYVSIATTIQVMACMRYEFAIVLPEEERDARALSLLGLVVCVGLALVSLLALLFFAEGIVGLLAAPDLRPWLWWVPATVLMMGTFNVFSYRLTRAKRFRDQASNQVTATAVTTASKLGAGWAGMGSPGLLVGILLGQLVPAADLARRSLRGESRAQWREAAKRIVTVAKEYRHFPLYIGPQAMLNSLTQSMPAFILAACSSVATVGHFAMAKALVMMPTNFLLQAFRKVYFPAASEAFNRSGNLMPLLKRSTFGLVGVGVLPFLTIFAFGPFLFSLLLGPEWVEAGHFARWIGLWFFAGLLLPPATVTAQVLRRQRFLLGVEVVLSLRVLVLWLVALRSDAMHAVAAYCLTTVVVSIGVSLIVFRMTRNCADQRRAERLSAREAKDLSSNDGDR